MAKIPVYDQQFSYGAAMPGRETSAADFGAGIGQTLSGMGETAYKINDVLQEQKTRAEVSDVHAKLATAEAEWSVAIAKRAQEAPLGDTTFAGKVNEDIGKYFEKFSENVALSTPAGVRAFQEGSAKLKAHFFQQAGLYQAQSVGKKAVADFGTVVDSAQKLLVSDPTLFDKKITDIKAMIADPNGVFARVPGEHRDKLEKDAIESLSYAAVQGTILTLNAPELARKQLVEGRWDEYINADKKDDLIRQADTGIHAKQSADERRRMLDERAKKDAQDAVSQKFLARIIDPKANGGSLSDAEILADPTLTTPQKQHFIDYKLTRARELKNQSESRTNPGEVRALMLEIHAADTDPKKTYNYDSIMSAYRAGRISTPEMTFLRREVDQLRDGSTQGFQKDVQQARSMVHSSFTRSIVGQTQPEAAADASYRFAQDLEEAIQRKRKANEDPRSLLDPGHKDYMLAPSRLQSYMSTASQALKAGADQVRGVGGPITTKLPTHKEYDTLKKGDRYTDPQGNVRTKQ